MAISKLTLALILVSFIFIVGCPAHTIKPMDSGSYAVPEWLTGEWDEIKPVLGTIEQKHIIKKLEGRQGSIIDITKNGGQNIERQCILSQIDDEIFLSAYNEGSSEVKSKKGWYIHKLVIKDNTRVLLLPVKENAIPETSEPAKTIEFLKKNKRNAAIFDEPIEYRKVVKSVGLDSDLNLPKKSSEAMSFKDIKLVAYIEAGKPVYSAGDKCTVNLRIAEKFLELVIFKEGSEVKRITPTDIEFKKIATSDEHTFHFRLAPHQQFQADFKVVNMLHSTAATSGITFQYADRKNGIGLILRER